MNTAYLLRETARNIARHRGGFALAATVIGVCLMLLSLFGVVTVNVMMLVRAASDRGEVYAFIADDVARAPSALLAQAAALEGVRAVRFVSKDEALQELRADLGPDAAMVDALAGNPLPASVRLSISAEATSLEDVEELERKLRLLPGVTEVWSGKDILTSLNRALRTVTILDAVLLLLISVSAIFIVFQTIESSISARRREIEIMEMVGATPAAVRIPFLLEGLAQGLAGGLLAFTVAALLFLVSRAAVPSLNLPVVAVAVSDLAIGLALGLTGAAIAVARRPQRSGK
jgi:cell division transport system permease protein